MIKIVKSKPFRWGMVVFWLLFIFAMSHLNATKSWLLTGRVMVALEKPIVNDRVDTQNMSETEAITYYSKSETVMHLLRKAAHIFEFMCLAISLSYALSGNFEIPKSLRFAFYLSFIYACFDEAHQLLIPGRTSNILDVGIDSIGILLGIILIKVVFAGIEKRKGSLLYEN